MWIEDETGFTWKMSEEEHPLNITSNWRNRIPRKKWDGPIYTFNTRGNMADLETVKKILDGKLPPNTLTNADGTPYVAESIHAPLKKIIPALATLDQMDMDRIRAIVREELAAMENRIVHLLKTEIQLHSGTITLE